MNRSLQSLILGLFVLSPLPAFADKDGDLRAAAGNGNLAKVEQLIKAGANVNNAGDGGGTPIIQAAKNGHIEVAQVLLFHGADPKKRNKKGNSAIAVADSHTHPELASILRNSFGEQSVSIDTGKILSSDEFKSHIGRAFARRKWKISHSENDRVIGRHDRKGIAYKVEAKKGGSLINLKFLRGYGAKNTSYLENLKRDLSADL